MQLQWINIVLSFPINNRKISVKIYILIKVYILCSFAISSHGKVVFIFTRNIETDTGKSISESLQEKRFFQR